MELEAAHEEHKCDAGELSLALQDNFEILEPLGRGASSTIYKARQKQIDRLVALKVLNAASVMQLRSLARFRREAQVLSELNHANIVRVLSFGVGANQPYLVMEYLEGQSLEELLAKQKTLSLEQFKSIFSQVIAGLAHAHARGILHRDLKPANIMLIQNHEMPNELVAKIVDFGLARPEEQSAQQTTVGGAFLGTPLYMSPEQAVSGTIDARSDLYSLACVMYESITGKRPFEGLSTIEIVAKHLNDRIETIKIAGELNISNYLNAVICTALQKNPADRYQSARELMSDLQLALDGRKPQNAKLKPAGEPSQSLQGVRKRVLWSLAIVCLTAIVSFLFAKRIVNPGTANGIRDLASENLHTVEQAGGFDFYWYRAKHVDKGAQSIADFRRALTLLRATQHPDPGRVAAVELDLASDMICQANQNPDESKKLLDDARAKLDAARQPGESSNTYDYSNMYLLRGLLSESSKNYDEAETWFKKKLKADQERGSTEQQSAALRRLACLERDRKNNQKADAYYTTAMRVINSGSQTRAMNEYFAVSLEWSHLYVDTGKPDRARQLIQNALAASYDRRDPTQNNLRKDLKGLLSQTVSDR